jgi:peptidyl-dipeptidase Dcp
MIHPTHAIQGPFIQGAKMHIRATAVLMLLGSCAHSPKTIAPDTLMEESLSTSTPNPLLASWTGPHGGLPPFDQARLEHYVPAIEEAMAEMLSEIDTIANQTDAPTFENTLAALEGTGKTFDQVMTIYWVALSTMSTPELREVEMKMAPKLAELNDKFYQNEPLFKRIEALYNADEKDALTAEQQRLVWKRWSDFTRNGAELDSGGKTRLAAINQELAGLYTTFGQNLLADEETWVTIQDEEQLAGLPEATVQAMSAGAEERSLSGKWVVVNTRSSVAPVLTYASDRALREQVWRAFVMRGDHGDEHDNKGLITKILQLRAERATLLGYATHAHWRLETSMAKTPDNAMALMEAVWGPAVARVEEEIAAQKEVAGREGGDTDIQPWDYRYYMEKVRKDRYDLDANEVKPYMELEQLREGMFWVAGQLYGLSFAPMSDVAVIHPDVRVWQVSDPQGDHVGVFYFDPYARTGKRSGAWMNAYRIQERYDGRVTPVISNNCNFVKGPPGTSVLISWDDARTLFHEFGHALHGLLSDAQYPTLAGTNVARDFVEFPSQVNEHWLGTPEVLKRFAKHHETGEPIPEELVAKIQKASTFNNGFSTVEFLASALIDMKLHLAGNTPIDPAQFEKETLGGLGMPDQIVMRHRTPQFAHVFSGDGYSAGYYSYLWADTLTADAAEAFKEAGSMYDEDTASMLRATVLSVGNTVDPAESFRAFRGRDVTIDALMRDRGFPVPAH